MPTYNSERYLKTTIDSIINQSIGFNNLELIIIDDKSTDSTRDIIGDFSNKHDNIIYRFLDKNLGHPGAVRNVGMEIASAEYVMFCDHDDKYDKYLCETLYDTITKESVDLVGCNNYVVDALKKPYKINTYDESQDRVYISQDNMFFYSNVYVWTKIFKKEIITEFNIEYITEGIGEDTIFCLDYLMHADSSIHLNHYFGYYHYFHGDNLSSSNKKWILDYFNMIDVIEDRFGRHLRNIDADKFYQNRINSILLAMLSLKENDWSTISGLIKKLHELENAINYKTTYEKSVFNRFINSLIIKNHLALATFAVYVSNRVYKNKFVLGMYRKYVLK